MDTRESTHFLVPSADEKTASGIVAEPLDFTPGPEKLSSRKLRRSQIETGIAPENRKRSHHHGTHQHPRPARGPQRRRRRDDPAPAPIAPVAGDGQAVAVLAALSAEPGGAAVAVIAARAGINTAAA